MQRDRDARAAQECALNRRRDRAAVDDVDADVRPFVHPAHHQIRFLREQLIHRQLYTIRGPAINGDSFVAMIHYNFVGDQRRGERNAMTGGTLHGLGSDDVNVAQ